LRGRDYGDDTNVKVPGEIDVQRARRILEELRRRFADPLRPQIELDYLERLLKDF
jgi:anti-anti-sigma regulatory factor